MDVTIVAAAPDAAVSTAESTTTAPPPAATAPPPPTTLDAPDPDEDDLDDLDELLDEFSSTKVNDSSAAPSSSGPGRPPAPASSKDAGPAADLDGITDDDFAKELQAGMANLLGDLETSPEMQQQFENLVTELGSAATVSSTPPTTGPQPSTTTSKAAPGSSSAEDPFQASILKTMERLSTSSTTATAATTNPTPPNASSPDDLLAAMLSQMSGGASAPNLPDGAAQPSEDELSGLLLGMMEQLTNKDILYEPMAELNGNYPAWMTAHAATTSKEDLDRYKEQQRLVGEIVSKFEDKWYKDENAADREFIVERMQKMQEMGSPPKDLVGDLGAAQEALGGVEEGCAQQ